MAEKFDLTNVVPLRDSIIAEIVIPASKSGILLSDTVKENASKHLKAVKFGPDVKGIKLNDELIVNSFDFMGQKINISEDYVLVPESVIVAVKRI